MVEIQPTSLSNYGRCGTMWVGLVAEIGFSQYKIWQFGCDNLEYRILTDFLQIDETLLVTFYNFLHAYFKFS